MIVIMENVVENELKSSVRTFVILLTLLAESFLGSRLSANDERDLPNAPVPVVAASGCREALAVLACSNGAQQTSTPRPAVTSSAAVRVQDMPTHRFWNRENIALLSLVAASRALDYSSTLNMRRRGRQEILLTNDIVDNHPAFAAIEAGGTVVSIGASYLFHRYQHHRLERWTSIIHASFTTTGAVRNYCLKTAHPSTTP